MIYIRDEGGLLRNGFNIYPLNSPNVGFVFKFSQYIFSIRYSRLTGRLNMSNYLAAIRARSEK